MPITLKRFFDKETFSFTYLLFDKETKDAAVIDPVLNFESSSATIYYSSAKELLSVIDELGLTLKWILETHVHADHMTAAYWLKQKTNAKILIGKGVSKVQNTFNQLYGLKKDEKANERNFDQL